MITLYAIRSKKHNGIYVGQTIDVDMRLSYHNSGYVKATKADRPWELIALQQFESRATARWAERQLKRSRGKRLKWIRDNGIV